ncbi:MAG: hypothetical protein KKA42_04860, partial [candidate division Zixibacteria bacterium]|nr:hypothetical protein [candidate division Zixibacteria bacterium]
MIADLTVMDLLGRLVRVVAGVSGIEYGAIPIFAWNAFAAYIAGSEGGHGNDKIRSTVSHSESI